jgi:SAM-dependent MidA family methyltransferase
MSLFDLPAASSLMSSRWSRDNLVTSHPARLYDGLVRESSEVASLERLVRDLQRFRGPCQLGSGRMGVLTWDIACHDEGGPFVLQVPRALDEPGRRGRSKREVPRRNVEHMNGFIDRGLARFVATPRDLLALGGDVPAAIFDALPQHRAVTFGRGAIQIERLEGKRSWLLELGEQSTADLLAEMVAALVYHYDPELDGGTAIADVCVNDGDFVVKRRPDGSFELRLLAVRALERDIRPSLLLLYLLQLMTYEDWSVDGELVGLPVLLGNPSVAFEGVVRGLRYRYRDQGRSEQQATREAERWIFELGRSPEGRAYRPWVERFLAGRLPLELGRDLRQRWWRLMPLQTKLGVLELAGRHDASCPEARAARALRGFLDRLVREIGRAPDPEADTVRLNDLGREGWLQLLAEARVPEAEREDVVAELLASWPHRALDPLIAAVPAARGLRRLKSRLSFGRVLTDAEQGTLESLAPLPKASRPPRAFANHEVFGALPLAPAQHAAAAQTFPSFERYMESALHDPSWGYYAQRVVIGKSGHFDTHPEEHSPQYGAWIAALAFKAWGDLLAHGELTEADVFPVVELGAGNGRLARDFLDAVANGASTRPPTERGRWATFASRVRYRIYERSAALRDKQRALLGADAQVSDGDARAPATALTRDFPDGLKGIVLSNELPDAFGVHKVALSADGEAQIALVVPRVERSIMAELSEALALRVDAADRAARATFGWSEHPDDAYVDAATYNEIMRNFAKLEAEDRADALSRVWLEEAYVTAAALPELAAHLRTHATQYALALAAEDSGVITYVNLYASRFISELGTVLAAGFLVTLDYGETTWGMVQGARRGEFPFRVYGAWQDYIPRPNDPYASPGSQDLTADVNFTELAYAGEAAGLKLVHFGPERDVTGDALPRLLRDSAGRESLTKFLGNPLFKILVLGTRASDALRGPLDTPLPLLAREQDVPKSRRPAISAIVAKLRGEAGPG